MNFQPPEEDDPRDDDQKRSSPVMCRNGQNEFGCKWPDCLCECAAAFANAAMRTGEGPSKLPDNTQKITVTIEVVDGRLVQRIVAPSNLPPGEYTATLEVKKDKS